jgi:uncharacterized repeat protein (TIGR01451 family)
VSKICRLGIAQAFRGGAVVARWISRCLVLAIVVFGSSALSSSPSHAISCDPTTTDPSSFLSVTYYLTASACTKTNPGSALLLSASIVDFNATVTFLPANVVVASSVTGPACTSSGPPNSGNVAGYNFQQNATCNVLISLTNGATLSFDAQFAADGYANSVTNVNFVPGVSNPSWTLSAIPSPTSFTVAGQPIGYSYTLTNTGDVTINSIAVSGTKTGTISCLASTLAVGASTTCTSSYTTLPADLGANIPYSVTATGVPAGGTLANASASGNITFTAQPSWTLSTIPSPTSFTAAGQAVAYGHTLTNTGNVTINSIALSGSKTGTISCPAVSLAVGGTVTCTSTYTTLSTDLGSNIPYSVTAVGVPTGGTLANAAASGSIAFIAQPSWTVSAIPNPTSFAAAGVSIGYSFTLTNLGNVPINSISMTGSKTGSISCPATPLAVGGTATCTSSYTTLPADLGSNIPYSATALGVPAGGTLANAAVSGSITFTALPALTIAEVATSPETYSNAGQVIAYSFKVTNTGNVTIGSIAVTDTKVSAITCPATTLTLGASTTCTGSYTTVASDVLTGSITDIAGATPVTSPAVTKTLHLDVNAVRQATQSAIRNFMNHRADMVTSMQPDTDRMHQRLTGTLFGGSTEQAPSQLGGPAATALGAPDGAARGNDDAAGPRRPTRGGSIGDLGSGRGGATNPVSVSGSTVDDSGRFAFATSLSQIQQTAEAAREAQDATADGLMALGAARRTAKPAKTQRPPAFDVWAEGSFAYYDNDVADARHRGHASMLYVGLDYQLHPAILVGMLVQFDWMSESSTMLGTSASGQGWMAGPYMSARLTRNLFFDARAAWGRSDNRVDPLGIYTDSFSTDRSLVSGKLTGNWSFGALQFRPSAEVIYFHETQKAYVNQINIAIPEQSISLGRFTFGPEVAYRMRAPNGGIVEPFIGVKGVWDFAKTADTTVAGTVIGNNAFRGKLEGGATYTAPSGVSVRASVSYDGIGGSDFQSYQGRAFVAVPLN